jgi:acetyl esterase/lipase
MDPEVAALREHRVATGFVPVYEMSVEAARQGHLDAVEEEGGPQEPVANVGDREIDGPDGNRIPIRIFDPGAERPAGALVWFFGGGWVVGSLDTVDRTCRVLANRSGCVVIAPQYRLAPEHRFPAAVRDAIAAARWVADNTEELGIDPNRIAVGGESAGGNQAAVVAQQLRDVPFALQVLVYPVTDRSAIANLPQPREEDEYFFNSHSMQWYWNHYLPDDASTDPLASPLRAESLEGLPPALVITAEIDPLLGEGEAYARRLQEDGVPVTLTRYEGMIHGFFGLAGVLSAGRRARDEVGAAVRRAVGPQ